jgi:hypothetical protein
LNEINLRNQTNVIYGASAKVYAAGEDRHLVQGAQPPNERRVPRRELSELEKLDRLFVSTFGTSDKSATRKSKDNQQIAQGGLCKKKLAELEQTFQFGSGDYNK